MLEKYKVWKKQPTWTAVWAAFITGVFVYRLVISFNWMFLAALGFYVLASTAICIWQRRYPDSANLLMRAFGLMSVPFGVAMAVGMGHTIH
jgi:hypothetical protein